MHKIILCIPLDLLFIVSKVDSPYPRSTPAGVAPSSGKFTPALFTLNA
jgi:hypothetical protein